MRHLKKGRILGRERAQRKALLKSLASSLIIHKRIETTLPKAKEMRPYVEKLITKAREKTPAQLRLVKKNLPKQAVKELFDIVAPAFEGRTGGYLRIMKKSLRESDNAPMAIVELLGFEKNVKKDVKAKKKDK